MGASNGTVAFVAVEGTVGFFDKKYGYSVPAELNGRAAEGCRVTVPFGKGNGKRQGIILEIAENTERSGLKPIIDITDDTPMLSRELLKLCEWMKEQYFCTYFDAVNAMIPAGLKYSFEISYVADEEFASDGLLNSYERDIFAYLKRQGRTTEKKLRDIFDNAEETLRSLLRKQAVLRQSDPKRRMGDITRKCVRIRYGVDIDSVKLTDRQSEIVSVVEASGGVSIKELQYFTGVSLSVVNALERKGILEFYELEELRAAVTAGTHIDCREILLNDEQQKAFDGLKDSLGSGNTALLYGVTGSGKTQVFLKLTDEVIASGRGVIIMVPEIALTPQMLNIFNTRYGDRIAVFHSAMSMGHRMDEYKRIKQGKAQIAIGTRSAVFAPFDDLGLIIIDEEQEHTYKSEKSPRFSARDAARFRVSYNKGLLCLASATPSLESYSAALCGKYSLFKISHRYGEAELPQVTLVDMRREILEGNSGAVSRVLAEAISQQLLLDKQIILLLNRRGHNTYVTCPSCGWVAQCPNCSVSLTYHSANGRLMCHYCGHSEPISRTCPNCGSENVRFMGLGTQKLEEELKLLFPTARVLRLDADSTMTRDSYASKLSAFADGKYDIMLGTQMVAKGLDFPNVTLVGVIGADHAMYSDDYRGFERTFSLLTQVIGRAGRAGTAGTAIIQTTDTRSNVIKLAVRQDYDAFYKDEIMTRRLMTYPPYCDICMVCVRSSERELARSAIDEIFENIKNAVNTDYKDIRVIILGPCAATVPRVNNRYCFRMIIKCKNNVRFRECLRNSANIRLRKDLSVTVDINPETVI